MGVDSDGGMTEGDVQDDVCGRAADARQPGEGVMVGRHIACVLGNQLPRQRDDILGLGAKQSDGLNIWNEPRLAELDHSLRCVRETKKFGSFVVYAFVVGMCRKYRCT